MTAFAFVAGGMVIVLAALLLWGRRRHAERISTLERERDNAISATAAASRAGERMRRAVDALPLGVLMYDSTGAVVYGNRAAAHYTSGRRTEAMVTATIEELLQGALRGESTRRTLEQYGPPQRTLVLSAWPLDAGDPTAGAVVLIDDVSERRRLEAVR